MADRVDPVKDFATRLRRLQLEAGGPSVRDLERLTSKLGTPFTRGTIQDKLTGRSAATWEFVEAFVRACALHAGAGEPELRPWRAWHTTMVRDVAAARAGRRRATALEVCPYRGLEVFTAEHAEWFFGRAVAVQRVLAGLATHRRGVLLLGPSGAGKSSLVRAGVLPALAAGQLPGSDRWIPVVTGAGDDLMGALDRIELPRTGNDEAGSRQRVLLVVDQLEVLLTPGSAGGQDQDRHEVIDRLASIVGRPELTVLLIMRDDFYPRLAAMAPELLEAIAAGLVNVPATLSIQDLRDIIIRPAEAVGVECQDDLAERIIADVLATDPGAVVSRQAPVTVLPLLELTLEQVWQRRSEGRLTHEAFQRTGGVAGSLTAWCDAVLGQLSPARQQVAQRLLTALVRPADDTHGVPAVRQQVPLSTLRELAAVAGPAAAGEPGRIVDEVLGVLTDHRLVTTRTVQQAGPSDGQAGVPVAELVHDALIRDWGALRGWVDQDHRFQDWLRRAGEQHVLWAVRRDPGDLLHGTELAEGVDWAARRRLPEAAAALVAASRQYQRSGVRRARRLATVLASLLVVAIAATGLALGQRQTAVTARQEAVSRQLAAQSVALMDVDFDLAARLSVQAYRTSPTHEALSSLYAAIARPLRRTLTDHTEIVTSVAFSPDGRMLVTAGLDGTRLRDMDTGQTRSIPTGAVMASVFSPDSRTLAAAGVDGTVQVWDVATGQVRGTLPGSSGHVLSVVFSPDGHTLVTSGVDGQVRLRDVATGQTRSTLTGHTGPVSSVAFSPDGRTLATAGDTTARLWDAVTGQTRSVLTGHTDSVLSVAFSPDGRTLATAGDDGTVRLWDAATGQTRTILSGSAQWLAFSPDGRTLAGGSSQATTRLWDTGTGQPRLTLPGGMFSAAFSPDGHTLATGGSTGTVRLWEVAGEQPRTTLTGHADRVNGVAFSPDGRTLATAGNDGTVRLWDAATGQTRSTLTGSAQGVAFSPDGHTLATAGNDGTVRLWDAATGQARSTLTGHTKAVLTVAFSPDGRTLATGSIDGSVRLWDAATGQTRSTLDGRAAALAFSPDGRTLATSRIEDTRIWDPATGRTRFTLPGHATSVAFSPDGRALAVGGWDGTVGLWDVATGRARSILTGHTDGVTAVAFSPDGRTLATGSNDRTIRLWDTATGPTRTTLTGHTDSVNAVAFSPDGRTLATAGSDRTVRLWAVTLPTPAAAIELICQAIDRSPTSRDRAMSPPLNQPGAGGCA
ncbi:nSTAND1 domain-containing NTPase [Catenuloplanes japonicus]|uniref:nSTAND1 domain-containing NTPase n=1 Tax=Catenuloplanes japonicus TaxID=33876 RepID=UPI00068D220C|nr:WD40 repeat domain-containing protein [Catenuloplanes japonicus]